MSEPRRASVVTATAEDAGQRLDNYLLRQLKGVPRTRIYRMVRKGEVRVNGRRARVSQRLQAGDQVRIPPVVTRDAPAPVRFDDAALAQFEQRVLFEDDAVLVWDKPSGMAVHGGSGLSWGVIELARRARPRLSRLSLVHRLDRETSGVLLLAKKPAVLKALHEQLRQHQMKKVYQALVAGRWPKRLNKVDLPLRKNVLKSGERMVVVDPAGQTAVSYFQPLEQCDAASLVQVRLKTGRTHQIRVHARASGHPLLGDARYGDALANRQARQCRLKRLALHAWQLGFRHPVTGDWLEVEAPVPELFTHVMQCLCQVKTEHE